MGSWFKIHFLDLILQSKILVIFLFNFTPNFREMPESFQWKRRWGAECSHNRSSRLKPAGWWSTLARGAVGRPANLRIAWSLWLRGRGQPPNAKVKGVGHAEGRVGLPPMRMPVQTLLCDKMRKTMPLWSGEPEEDTTTWGYVVLSLYPHTILARRRERSLKSLNIYLGENRLSRRYPI